MPSRGPPPYERTPATCHRLAPFTHRSKYGFRPWDDPITARTAASFPIQARLRVHFTSFPSGQIKRSTLARGSAMVVVDEKTMLPPPPAYSRAHTNVPLVPEFLPPPPPFSAPFRSLATLSDLPSHVLLHIVHRTFPQAPDKDYNRLERQRKTLRWLTTSLRLVNRTFYIGMSHCLPHLHMSSCPMTEAEADLLPPFLIIMWLCTPFDSLLSSPLPPDPEAENSHS